MVAENPAIDFSKVKLPILLTKEYILARVSQEEIYRHYLGDRFQLKRSIKSPLRNDLTPSFSFFTTATGDVKWRDHAKNLTGDCFDFVQELLGVDYKTALTIIDHDILSKLSPFKEIAYGYKGIFKNEPRTSKTQITISERPFGFYDERFWAKYSIDIETLAKFNVVACQDVWINGAPRPLKSSGLNPIFAFKFENTSDQRVHYKIYRPYAVNREDKWKNNCDRFDVIGYDQLPKKGNMLFITKSMKDVMVLYKMGINAISPQSESSSLPSNLVANLKERFQYIFLLFDDDETGIKAANSYQTSFGFTRALFVKDNKKGSKDISDMVNNYSLDEAYDWLKGSIKELLPFFTWDYLTKSVTA